MKYLKSIIVGFFLLTFVINASSQTNSVSIDAPNPQIYTSFQWNTVIYQYFYDDGTPSTTAHSFLCAGDGTAVFPQQLDEAGELHIHVEDNVVGWHIAEGNRIIPLLDDSEINVSFTWVKDPIQENPHE